LRTLVGNELLVALRNRSDDLKKTIEGWRRQAELAARRKPVWALVERLAHHAGDVAAAAEPLSQAEAIRTGRMLLEPNDPVTPVRTALAKALRQAVNDANGRWESAFAAGMSAIDGNSVWQRLQQNDRKRILSEVALVAPGSEDVRTDESLLAALDHRSLEARRAEADAVPARVARALELAARAVEPKVRTVALERATLRTEPEVGEWLERQKQVLTEAVKHGPVYVS
jgi:hypothetical protein